MTNIIYLDLYDTASKSGDMFSDETRKEICYLYQSYKLRCIYIETGRIMY